MAGFSDTIKQGWLEGVLPNGTDVYIGLFTAMPDPDGDADGEEFTGGGYARVAHQAWNIATSADGEVMYRTNVGAIEFAAAVADWSGLIGVGVWDAAVAGNILYSARLRDVADVLKSFSISIGDQFRFIEGDLKIGIGTPAS